MTDLAFSPDGRRLATVSLDGFCRIWDAADWQEIRSLAGTTSPLDAVTWSPVGKLLAAGNDYEVMLWSADAFELLHVLKTPGKGMIAFTPDGRRLYTARCLHRGGEAHTFTKWDVTTGAQQAIYEMPTGGGFAFLHLDPDGRRVFVSQALPPAIEVRAYDAETGPGAVRGSQPPRPRGERGN